MASTLQEWAKKGQLKSATLSEDGKTLSLDGSTIPADEVAAIDHDGKSCKYTLASVFLQILDPSQGLMAYRNACKKHSVTDPIKALDKPTVVGYFVGSSSAGDAAEPAAPPPRPAAPSAPKEDRGRKEDRKKHRSSKQGDKKDRKDRKRPPPPSAPPPKKKEKKVMTTEQMLDNLNVVAGKREGFGDNAELAAALSASGFELNPDMLKESIADIISMEIPVGNSASILRPAPARDFQRVLDLYLETEKKRKPQAAPSLQRPYLVGKKPIIVLPKGMTAPITMWNAHEFFSNSKFLPRDVVMKQGATKASIQNIVRHQMDARRGGHVLEFELMDNPTAKLAHNAKEWERIVAVISLGASWQFKDWPRGYSAPVDLFGRVFGFYIGLENDKEPPELSKWAVKKGALSRDKRGLDSVCHANFWDGLEDRLVTKKPEFLPRKEEL